MLPKGTIPRSGASSASNLALPGIHIPEQYGGAGFGMVELCIVTEEMGRALLCAPYFSTAVLAANAILNAGTEAQKSGLLPDIANGARLAALAVTEPERPVGPARHPRSSRLPMRTAICWTEQKLRRGWPHGGLADRRWHASAGLLVVRGWRSSPCARMPAALTGASWNRWTLLAR